MKLLITIRLHEGDETPDPRLQRQLLWRLYRSAQQRAEDAVMLHMANHNGPPSTSAAGGELVVEVEEESAA
jgi:hypothetical protein